MKQRLGYRTLSVLFSDISVMLTTADSLSSLVEVLSRDAKEPALKAALARILNRLEEGDHFSEAMAQAGCFPDYARIMVASGEEVGRLENVTASLAEYYDRRDKLRSLARAALLSPLILLSLLAAILGAFMGLVLPMLSRVYVSLGGETGFYTQLAYLVAGLAFVLIAAALIAVFLLWLDVRKQRSGGALTGLWQKSPLTAPIAALFSRGFFISDLATRVAGGSMVDLAFEEAAAQVADPALKMKTDACIKALNEGGSLANVLYETELLPHLCCHILAGGQKNGNMEEALDRVSRQLFEEAESRTEALVRSIEPVLTGFFTLAVGISLLSIMIPLIGVITAIG